MSDSTYFQVKYRGETHTTPPTIGEFSRSERMVSSGGRALIHLRKFGIRVDSLVRKASGMRVATIDGGDLVAFAKLLARGNHPIGEAEHCPTKEARPIDSRINHKLSQADLLRFIQDFLTVIFRHIFVIPVVHHVSFGETDNAIDFQRLGRWTPRESRTIQ
jgi:hypothetical protein